VSIWQFELFHLHASESHWVRHDSRMSMFLNLWPKENCHRITRQLPHGDIKCCHLVNHLDLTTLHGERALVVVAANN